MYFIPTRAWCLWLYSFRFIAIIILLILVITIVFVVAVLLFIVTVAVDCGFELTLYFITDLLLHHHLRSYIVVLSVYFIF